VAAILGALWFLALAPDRQRASELAGLVTTAEARRAAAITKVAGAERAKAHYATDYATLARLGKAVPPKADVPSLVFQLETAARTAKVDFRKVTLSDAPPAAPDTSKAATPSGISSSPFNFTFEGSFVGLQRMLREIGRFSRVKGTTISISGRLLTLDQVKLSAGRSGLPSVKAEVTANAYVAPIASALPGPTAPQTPATTPTPSPASHVAP
jgi:hypothetical protein